MGGAQKAAAASSGAAAASSAASLASAAASGPQAESEREYIREESLEGQASARERGRHGGRPKVVDDDMAQYARSQRANGVPVPQIAQKLVITSGKNKGQRPSVATVYSILADTDEADGTA